MFILDNILDLRETFRERTRVVTRYICHCGAATVLPDICEMCASLAHYWAEEI